MHDSTPRVHITNRRKDTYSISRTEKEGIAALLTRYDVAISFLICGACRLFGDSEVNMLGTQDTVELAKERGLTAQHIGPCQSSPLRTDSRTSTSRLTLSTTCTLGSLSGGLPRQHRSEDGYATRYMAAFVMRCRRGQGHACGAGAAIVWLAAICRLAAKAWFSRSSCMTSPSSTAAVTVRVATRRGDDHCH